MNLRILVMAAITASVAACTADISGSTVETVRAKCAVNGGVGSVRAEAIAFDDVIVHCGNGTKVRLHKGKEW
jgi:hypothetical protein